MSLSLTDAEERTRREGAFSSPGDGFLSYTFGALPSTTDVGNSYPQPPDVRSYEVEYVDGVTCPRCGRETHPDTAYRPCRGNHYTGGE